MLMTFRKLEIYKLFVYFLCHRTRLTILEKLEHPAATFGYYMVCGTTDFAFESFEVFKSSNFLLINLREKFEVKTRNEFSQMVDKFNRKVSLLSLEPCCSGFCLLISAF